MYVVCVCPSSTHTHTHTHTPVHTCRPPHPHLGGCPCLVCCLSSPPPPPPTFVGIMQSMMTTLCVIRLLLSSSSSSSSSSPSSSSLQVHVLTRTGAPLVEEEKRKKSGLWINQTHLMLLADQSRSEEGQEFFLRLLLILEINLSLSFYFLL